MLKSFWVTYANAKSERIRALTIQDAMIEATERVKLIDYRVISIYEE